MTYADVLKEIRAKAGMTQVEFSDYFCTPFKTYIHWEQQANRVPENLLRLLAYKLALDPNHKEFTKQDIVYFNELIDHACPKKTEE